MEIGIMKIGQLKYDRKYESHTEKKMHDNDLKIISNKIKDDDDSSILFIERKIINKKSII